MEPTSKDRVKIFQLIKRTLSNSFGQRPVNLEKKNYVTKRMNQDREQKKNDFNQMNIFDVNQKTCRDLAGF